MKGLFRAALGATLISTPVLAQNGPSPAPVPAQTPALMPIAAAGQAVLRTGTEVPLKLSEQLTTKNKAVRVGQRFRMEVSEDIKVGGQTVIPVGSPAMGEVTSVRNKGMWGKSGHIGARALYIQVNGRQIRLSGTFDDKGVTGTGGVVAAIALLPVAGFFTTGTSANLPIGAGIKAFVDEDVPLSFSTPAPAPLVIAPAAPAMVVTSSAGTPAPGMDASGASVAAPAAVEQSPVKPAVVFEPAQPIVQPVPAAAEPK